MRKIGLIFILMLLQSCNGKVGNTFYEIANNYSFNSTISSSDKIIVRPKKHNQTESTRNDSCFENKVIFKAQKSEEIKMFEKLFENSNYTDYCCCPETNYCIDLYKDSKKIDSFYADTLEFKNKIRIFESSYQYSFIIEKAKWKTFLNEIRINK
jgi:predicted Ser/Thr protein kinase